MRYPFRSIALRVFASLAVILLSGNAAIAATPGWLFTLDARGESFDLRSVMQTDSFVEGRAIGDAQVRLLDGAQRVLFAAPLSIPQTDPARLAPRAVAVRVPALAQARRIEIVDTAGNVVWGGAIDDDIRERARRTAQDTAMVVATAGRARLDAPRSPAIERLAVHTAKQRASERQSLVEDFLRQPDAERSRRLRDFRRPGQQMDARHRDDAAPVETPGVGRAAAARVPPPDTHASPARSDEANITADNDRVDLIVRPVADAPISSLNWIAECSGSGERVASPPQTGDVVVILRLRRATSYNCSFITPPVYPARRYTNLRVAEKQAWFPQVERRNRLTLTLNGGSVHPRAARSSSIPRRRGSLPDTPAPIGRGSSARATSRSTSWRRATGCLPQSAPCTSTAIVSSTSLCNTAPPSPAYSCPTIRPSGTAAIPTAR